MGTVDHPEKLIHLVTHEQREAFFTRKIQHGGKLLLILNSERNNGRIDFTMMSL